MSNSFGHLFRITTYGESHGPAIGVVIDGCPAGLKVDYDLISREMARRRPGQSAIVTQRKEADEVEILSGVFEDHTTGMPIHLMIRNEDARSKITAIWLILSDLLMQTLPTMPNTGIETTGVVADLRPERRQPG